VRSCFLGRKQASLYTHTAYIYVTAEEAHSYRWTLYAGRPLAVQLLARYHLVCKSKRPYGLWLLILVWCDVEKHKRLAISTE